MTISNLYPNDAVYSGKKQSYIRRLSGQYPRKMSITLEQVLNRSKS